MHYEFIVHRIIPQDAFILEDAGKNPKLNWRFKVSNQVSPMLEKLLAASSWHCSAESVGTHGYVYEAFGLQDARKEVGSVFLPTSGVGPI